MYAFRATSTSLIVFVLVLICPITFASLEAVVIEEDAAVIATSTVVVAGRMCNV